MAALSLAATILAWPSFGWPLTSQDESILLVYAEQVRAGLIPHRDFYTVYGPAPFYALATLFEAFGSALDVERAFGLVLHLAIALGCYGIGRSHDRATALMAGAASLILLAPLGTVAYAWLGAMAGLVIGLAFAEQPGRYANLVAGLAAALGVCFRPELLVALVPILLPHLWRSSRRRWMSTGLALGLAPLAAFAMFAGERMWWNIGPGRAGVNGSLRLSDKPVQSAAILVATLGVTATLVWFAWRRRSRVTLSHALVAVAILPQTIQRADPEHAIYTLCVTAPLLIVGAMSSEPSPDYLRRRNMLLVTMTIAFIGGFGALLLKPSPQTVEVQFGDRSARIDVAELPTLLATRSALIGHAPRDGVVFVGSTDMSRDTLTRVLVYYLMPELHPRAYFLELTGGVPARAGSGLARDVQTADVLLLTRIPAGLMGRVSPFAHLGSNEANSVVAGQFCPVAETAWGQVYARKPCATGGLTGDRR